MPMCRVSFWELLLDEMMRSLDRLFHGKYDSLATKPLRKVASQIGRMSGSEAQMIPRGSSTTAHSTVGAYSSNPVSFGLRGVQRASPTSNVVKLRCSDSPVCLHEIDQADDVRDHYEATQAENCHNRELSSERHLQFVHLHNGEKEN